MYREVYAETETTTSKQLRDCTGLSRCYQGDPPVPGCGILDRCGPGQAQHAPDGVSIVNIFRDTVTSDTGRTHARSSF